MSYDILFASNDPVVQGAQTKASPDMHDRSLADWSKLSSHTLIHRKCMLLYHWLYTRRALQMSFLRQHIVSVCTLFHQCFISNKHFITSSPYYVHRNSHAQSTSKGMLSRIAIFHNLFHSLNLFVDCLHIQESILRWYHGVEPSAWLIQWMKKGMSYKQGNRRHCCVPDMLEESATTFKNMWST